VPYRKTLYLSDGGVYDNLGLEAVWDRFETVLVSDAGAPFAYAPNPLLLKYSQVKKTLRVLDITVNQARALRKRRLIDDFKAQVRKGAYWGIATHIDHYGLPDAMVKDNAVTASLQHVRTRLNPFSEKEQGQLINWGYALCDAAIRRYVQGGLPAPASFPCPAVPIG
jgi:NTE family protein